MLARSKSSSEVSDHSDDSDIHSLTDLEQYLVHSETTAPITLAHSKRSGSRLRAFGSLRGNHFVCMLQNGGSRTFYFDESGAVYICIARYNEYVNFGDENGIAFYSFYFI